MHRESNLSLPIIPNGASVSTKIDFRFWSMAGLWIPAEADGSNVSLEINSDAHDESPSPGSWGPLYDEEGNTWTLAFTAGRGYTLPTFLAPWPWFRVKLDSNQTGDTQLRVVRKS